MKQRKHPHVEQCSNCDSCVFVVSVPLTCDLYYLTHRSLSSVYSPKLESNFTVANLDCWLYRMLCFLMLTDRSQTQVLCSRNKYLFAYRLLMLQLDTIRVIRHKTIVFFVAAFLKIGICKRKIVVSFLVTSVYI